MLMPDLSLHRSNSRSVDTSCRRIRNQAKTRDSLRLQRRKGEDGKKEGRVRHVCVKRVQGKVSFQQHTAVKGKRKGRRPPCGVCSSVSAFRSVQMLQHVASAENALLYLNLRLTRLMTLQGTRGKKYNL